MPANERAHSAVAQYCIRYHLDSVSDDMALRVALAEKSVRWFWGLHNTERPHLHWYVETTLKEQALRSVIARFRKNPKDTRWYSVSTIRSTIEQYGSYVMLKPETSDSDMAGITEDEVFAMNAIAQQVSVRVTKEEKKSKSVMALLLEKAKYCPQLTLEENFNIMYDFLVENGLYNMYTEIKMRQLFGMWKARGEPRDEYRKTRNLMYKRSVADYFLS